jgi:hypothetical protein
MQTIIKNIMLVFLGACSAILVSCQHVASASDRISSNETPKMSVSTLESYMTPIRVSEYPDQVTDGKLSLSIDLVDDACFQASKPVSIRLTFSNLTDEALTIPADFSVAVNRKGNGGDLIPFITTAEGTDVLSLADHQLVDIFSTPSDIYREIPANQKIEFDVDFVFPQDLVTSESTEDYDLATPSPGPYFIRLVYSEYRRNDDIWYGVIGSNRLGICLLN